MNSRLWRLYRISQGTGLSLIQRCFTTRVPTILTRNVCQDQRALHVKQRPSNPSIDQHKLTKTVGNKISPDDLPYMEQNILARSKQGQTNRVINNIRHKENDIENFRFKIIGLLNEVHQNTNNLSRLGHIEINSSNGKAPVRWNLKSPNFTEVVFYSIMYTIHYCLMVSNNKMDRNIALERLDNISTTVRKGKVTGLLSLFPSDNDVFLSDEVQELCQLYQYGRKNVTILLDPVLSKRISDLLQVFSVINKKYHAGVYNLDDLKAWMLSISSKSINDACKAIVDHSTAPNFILVDIAYRTPNTQYELRLVLQIFKNYFDLFSPLDQYYLIFHVLEQCQIYDSEEIVSLIKFYLSQYKTINFPYSTSTSLDSSVISFLNNFNTYSVHSVFDKSLSKRNSIQIFQLNWLLWTLSDGATLLNRPKLYHLTIIKAQNLIIDFMIEKFSQKQVIGLSDSAKKESGLEVKNLQNWLSILGNLSLINSLSYVSNKAASRVLKSAELRFFVPFVDLMCDPNQTDQFSKLLQENNISIKVIRSLIAKFFYVKLRVSADEAELIDSFTQSFDFSKQHLFTLHFPSSEFDMSRSAILWRALVEKIDKFNLLTPNRSALLAKKILLYNFNLNFTNIRIVNLLIRQLSDFEIIAKLIKFVNNKKLMNSSIMQNLIVKLYRFAISSNKNKYKNIESLTQGNVDVLTFVRNMFNSIELPGRSLIGQVLLFESQLQPHKVHLFYQKLLMENGAYKTIPDVSCIRALLEAPLKVKDLVWGDQYAVQIGIYEFKQWTLKTINSKNTFSYLKPNEVLWLTYLKNLYAYNYLDELTEIMSWWEAIRYVPTKSLLLHLLHFLPIQTADRLREYSQKHLTVYKSRIANENSTEEERDVQGDAYVPLEQYYSAEMWPWPTQYELDAFRSASS